MISARLFAAILFLPTLAGCGLPAAAPTSNLVESRTSSDWRFYEVKVNPRALEYLALASTARFPASFRSLKYRPSLALRPGDQVSITVYETGGPSLFSSPVLSAGQTQTRATTIPTEVVEPNGQIVIPFAGSVRVEGLTPLQAADAIAKSLAKQAVSPQVVVSLVSNGANTASVGGDINKPGPVPLTLRGERVLDALDLGGGPKFPLSEMDVRLTRRGTTAIVPLSQILRDPSQNVTIRPSDEITAVHNPRTFTMLGATSKVAQYNFDTPQVTLAEAVGRAGGSVDTVGDPAGVFVFRREPTPEAAKILETVSEVDGAIDSRGANARGAPLAGPTTLMVYRIDLNTSDGYFIAQNMQIRDKDVILITDAVGTQLVKLTTIVRGFTGILFDVGAAARG